MTTIGVQSRCMGALNPSAHISEGRGERRYGLDEHAMSDSQCRSSSRHSRIHYRATSWWRCNRASSGYVIRSYARAARVSSAAWP